MALGIFTVALTTLLLWSIIRSSSIAGRQYDDLVQKKFFGEEGVNELY